MNAPVNLGFTATDAGSGDQLAGFAWTIDYGDGNSETVPASTASPLARTHAWAAAGTYTVTVNATDKNGATSTVASKSIGITSGSLPVVDVHADVTVEATNGAGAVVNYMAGTATGGTGALTLTYSNTSGSVFPLGTTTVTITATYTMNITGTKTFTVTVLTTPISRTCTPLARTAPS